MIAIETILQRIRAEKKSLMREREHNKTLLEPVRKLAFDVTASDSERKPFVELYKAFEHMAYGIALRKAGNVSTSLRRHIQYLQESPLSNKKDVLQTIPVISTPVAASYLGVSANALLTSENHCRAIFALEYIGIASYSMSDLQLISENPHWLLPEVVKAPKDSNGRLLPVPAYKVFVDWEIATAYTDLKLSDLNMRVRKSTHPARPYRLSDLEKIRVAKLNGQQH